MINQGYLIAYKNPPSCQPVEIEHPGLDTDEGKNEERGVLRSLVRGGNLDGHKPHRVSALHAKQDRIPWFMFVDDLLQITD